MKIAVALLAVLLCTLARAADDFADVRREVAARHDEAVKRLRDWIALPSIAAENLNSAEGADYMARLAPLARATILPRRTDVLLRRWPRVIGGYSCG